MSEERVQIYQMSHAVEHYEIAFAGNGLARLYCEIFQDKGGQAQSTSRLHFDGDISSDIMRQVIDAVDEQILQKLPRGVCIVYRGHMETNFDYGVVAPASGVKN